MPSPESLSFIDLFTCILVSHTWHDTFIPILWRDVVTFRTIQRAKNYEHSIYIQYFLSPITLRALCKHSHNIRAITCRDPDMLQVLSRTCTNLIEVNFILARHSQITQGLYHLGWLVVCNSNLRAISIENMLIDTQEKRDQLKAFVQFLDDYPNITCLYFGPGIPMMRDVLVKRLTLIRTHNKFSIRFKGYIPKSCRGPSLMSGRQYQWPARGQPLTTYHYTRPQYTETESRWEHEDKESYYRPTFGSFAVLENDGVLEVCLPYEMLDFGASLIFDMFPAVSCLRGESMTAKIFKGLSLSASVGQHLHVCL